MSVTVLQLLVLCLYLNKEATSFERARDFNVSISGHVLLHFPW